MYFAGKKAGAHTHKHTHNIKAQGIANAEDALKDDLTRQTNDAPTLIHPFCPTW